MAESKSSKAKPSVKHLQISKNQSRILMIVAIATVVVVFSLFATKAIVSKGLYQRRALHEKREVASQLKANLDAANTLFTQYKVFADQDPNVLGGTIDGTGNLDGDNPRIVLDSLPSDYDAPALASSLEKILVGRSVTIDSIKVTDDPNTNSYQPETSPKPKQVLFSFDGTTNYKGATQLLQDFERSIRPFDVTVMDITGNDNSLKLSVTMNTYLQPAKSLDLQPTKEVK